MKTFNFETTNENSGPILTEVRVVEIDNQTWWVLADVCRALGLSNSRKVAGRLDDDEVCNFKLQGKGFNTHINIVNESGLYAVILRSNKPSAKAFRKWVTSEVLPEIRKTGSFNANTHFQLPNNIDCYGMSIEANNRAVGLEGVKYFSGKAKIIGTPKSLPISMQNQADYVDNTNLAVINNLTPHNCRLELKKNGLLEHIQGNGWWPTELGQKYCVITKVGSRENKQAFVIGWPIDILNKS